MTAGAHGSAPMAREGATLPLAEGTRLIHIGPHKTGTTALQGALFAARPELLRQGVRHAGWSRNPASAVASVVGRRSRFRGAIAPSVSSWNRLLREIRKASEPRVVLSSEFFADAEPEAIRRVIDDLDPARVHVVVTLRPLARILPSQWQQYVQAGVAASYQRWLNAMLRPDPSRPTRLTPTFWRRHRHDRLIARWAEVVGPDRMTVIALDDRDHGMVLRVFEQLTGLREGTLVAPPDLVNRSMTMPEIEAVRAFNIAFRAEGLGNDLHAKVMTFGASPYMKLREPDPSEPRVETPQWALDRAAEIAREMVDNIAASGVPVVGDLERLARPADPGSGIKPAGAPGISPEVAATMATGVALALGAGRQRATPFASIDPQPDTASANATPEGLASVPTYVIAGVIGGRLADAGRTVAGRIRRRMRRSSP